MMNIHNTVRVFSHIESPWKVYAKMKIAESSIFPKQNFKWRNQLKR